MLRTPARVLETTSRVIATIPQVLKMIRRMLEMIQQIIAITCRQAFCPSLGLMLLLKVLFEAEFATEDI